MSASFRFPQIGQVYFHLLSNNCQFFATLTKAKKQLQFVLRSYLWCGFLNFWYYMYRHADSITPTSKLYYVHYFTKKHMTMSLLYIIVYITHEFATMKKSFFVAECSLIYV